MLAKRIDIEPEVLGEPMAVLWEGFPARKVAMMPAPVGLQPSKYIQAKWHDGQFGHTDAVGLQAAHNGKELCIRLEWACETRADSVKDNNEFADAAALLFPLSEAAPLIMGAKGAPVSLWHWRAHRPKEARSNVAEGIGTSSPMRSGPAIVTRAVYHGGRWAVVFRRVLATEEAGVVGFEPGKSYRTALAVWSGANAERGGLKAFSPEWVELSLEDR